MQSNSSSPKTMHRSQLPRRKDKGPNAWNANVCRELIVLEIFAMLTDDQMVKVLRKSNDGKGERNIGDRNLPNKRQRLFGSRDRRRWRPRDADQMHRRISHFYTEYKPGHGPRVFSLYPAKHKQWQDVPGSLEMFNIHCRSSPVAQTDLHKLNIRLLKADESKMIPEKARIVLAKPDTNHLVRTCHLWQVADDLDKMAQLSSAGSSVNAPAAWSANLAYINLMKHPELTRDKFGEVLRHRVIRLALNNCHLKKIPSFLKSLSHLEYVNMARNRLTKVSASMLPTKLTYLDLRHNRVVALSEDLMQLTSLQVLAVAYNSITVLPSWLSDWESLKAVLVEGNPLGLLSYSFYYQAFELGKEEVTSQLCTKCLHEATRALKNLLSPSADWSNSTTNNAEVCMCKKGFTIHIDNPSEVFRNNEIPSRSAAQRKDYSPCATSFLRNYLYYMSMQSDDIGSSVSAFTLRSMSSAGTNGTSSNLDREALLNFHCCLREPGDGQVLCIHVRVATWVATRAPYYKSIYHRSQPAVLDLDGNSIIHIMAALGASPADLEDCIEHGAPVMALNRDGETFLHRAVTTNWDESELVELLGYLVCKGFRFTHQDHRGNTVFHKSGQFIKAAKKVPALKTCCGLRLTNAHGIEVVVPARSFSWTRGLSCIGHCQFQTLNTAHLYIDQAPPPWLTCSHTVCHATGFNPLHRLLDMVRSGHGNFIINGSESSVDYCTALNIILRADDVDVMVNQYDIFGKTPLMYLIKVLSLGGRDRFKRDQIESCMNALLSKGASPAAVSREGETALHYAVYYGLPDATRLLIGAGANVNARNGKRLSVMQLLHEIMHKMKANIQLFARYQECVAILHEAQAQMHPSAAEELQWPVGIAI